MGYPHWLPFPSAWLRALIPAVVFPSLWVGLIRGLVVRDGTINPFTVWLLPLLVVAPIFVVIWLHHWLFGKRTGWPGVESLWEGVFGLQVLLIALGLGVAVIFPVGMSQDWPSDSDVPEGLMVGFWWMVFTTSAYLYQLEHLVRHRKAIAQKTTQAKWKRDIDTELKNLKRDLK